VADESGAAAANDRLVAEELIALRTRMHEVSNQLHNATVRVEVTAARLDAATAQFTRSEGQLARIETAVLSLQQAKANLDGRLVTLFTLMGVGEPLLLWALTRLFPMH
jgi:chromosome segregation ATPase